MKQRLQAPRPAGPAPLADDAVPASVLVVPAAAPASSALLTGGTFELSAPGMVDRVEVAALASAALGRPVQATRTSVADLPIPPGPLRDGRTQRAASYDAHGFAGGNALVLRAVLGREPRTLQQYLHELAATT